MTKLIIYIVCRYRVHEIGDPYLTYTIQVKLQQLEYERRVRLNTTTGRSYKQIWRDVGKVYVGPSSEAQQIGATKAKRGRTGTPQVYILKSSIHFYQNVSILQQLIVTWQGDFRTTSFFPSFKSKYLLIPDPKVVPTVPRVYHPGEAAEYIKKAMEKPEYRVRSKKINNNNQGPASVILSSYYLGWRRLLSRCGQGYDRFQWT